MLQGRFQLTHKDKAISPYVFNHNYRQSLQMTKFSDTTRHSLIQKLLVNRSFMSLSTYLAS